MRMEGGAEGSIIFLLREPSLLRGVASVQD
jgi:hypothetical protein